MPGGAIYLTLQSDDNYKDVYEQVRVASATRFAVRRIDRTSGCLIIHYIHLPVRLSLPAEMSMPARVALLYRMSA